MTLAEFKAWFNGFAMDILEAPTAKEWKTIKARVAAINGSPVSERHFYKHFWPPSFIAPYWAAAYDFNGETPVEGWDSKQAMFALGQVDSQNP